MILKIKLDLKTAEELLTGIDDEFIKKYILPNKTKNYKKREIQIDDILYDNKSWMENGNFSISQLYHSDTILEGSVYKWPKTSNLLCWFCTRPIEGSPIGLPYKKEGKIYHTIGVFCSYSCALTCNFSSENTLVDDKYNTESILNELYMKTGGKGKILKAPPKIVLLKYGGKLTNDEYNQLLTKNNIVVTITMPPVSCVDHVINIKSLEPSKDSSKYKLYRKKPLYSNLSKFLK